MASVQVKLSLADDVDHEQVLSRLRAAGLSVDSSDEALGFVAGRCEENAVARLAKVSGVMSVEPSRSVQLPDKDSPVQ